NSRRSLRRPLRVPGGGGAVGDSFRRLHEGPQPNQSPSRGDITGLIGMAELGFIVSLWGSEVKRFRGFSRASNARWRRQIRPICVAGLQELRNAKCKIEDSSFCILHFAFCILQFLTAQSMGPI